ncbi:uncharacterized protein VP01_99g13 [Puccinia sorghi]|uniref:Uncharacterized protein n=1 Tax=Puccinia sorghi TaxID=27349 RepID=A0A0L6U574_9BASI|nr:uncharacterized protein VP01_99g13 [Puccinia sorghi]
MRYGVDKGVPFKTKPVKGKGYTAGKSNLTAVIFNDQEAEMLLGCGVFCLILEHICKNYPDFRDSLLPAGKKITPNSEIGQFIDPQILESKICEEWQDHQLTQHNQMLFQNRKAFSSDKEPLGAVIGHEVDITLNIESSC